MLAEVSSGCASRITEHESKLILPAERENVSSRRKDITCHINHSIPGTYNAPDASEKSINIFWVNLESGNESMTE